MQVTLTGFKALSGSTKEELIVGEEARDRSDPPPAYGKTSQNQRFQRKYPYDHQEPHDSLPDDCPP